MLCRTRTVLVQDADIVIAGRPIPWKQMKIIEETENSNSSGQTENLPLEGTTVRAFHCHRRRRSVHNARITIRIQLGILRHIVVSGTEVLADVTAIQGIRLRPLSNAPDGEQTETVTIPDHTLYGDLSSKKSQESGFKHGYRAGEDRFYPEWVVPQTIVVHDGVPNERVRANYYVPISGSYIKIVILQ